MSNSKRNKTDMAPSFQKNRKVQDTKTELQKLGDKAQPTLEQMQIAQIIETKHEDPALEAKVKEVMNATQKSEEEVMMALFDCDYEPNAAVTVILEGGTQDKWSTSTKKKKNKPPVEKRDSSGNNADKSANQAGDTEDWNDSDNADENSAPSKALPKGKGPANRTNRPPSRPWNKRGGVSRPNGKENFGRTSDGNQDYSRGGKFFQGRNAYKNSRVNSQKDGDSGEREISDRLGQGEQFKQDSASDWDSDNSDKIVGRDDSKQNDSHSKQADNKWQSDDNWKNQRGGRGGSRQRGGYNSYPKPNNEDGDSRPYYNKQGSGGVGGRGRGGGGGGRYPRSSDRGGYRGRMSNGPSRSWSRGAPRGRGRGGGSRPSIDTWNPTPKDNHEAEDWDQEEDYTGSLADTKVFTPSNVEQKINPEPIKEPEPEISSQMISPSCEVSSNQLSTSASQFLSQLTNASSKSLPTSVFNDVHFNKTDMPTSDYGTGFSINSFVDTESPSMPLDDMSRVKPLRPRLPPPSKIPTSAVEMPPDVGTGMKLDVQFGALDLGESMGENVQTNAPETSSPTPEPAQPPASEPSNLLHSDNQNYTSVRSSVPNAMSQLPELLSSKSETSSTSNYYPDSVYQTNQFPKSTHQSYSYTTQGASTYNSPNMYGSAGLGTTSLSAPYPQTYSSGNLARPSALTSTTNSKEFDVPTPSVNISPINPSSGTTVTPSSILSSTQGNVSSKSSSTMSKLMTVPQGVAAAPIVNQSYILNQTPAAMPYFQPPVYSIDDVHMFPQQRIPNFYDMSYQNTAAARDGVPYNLSDTRFAQGDTNTSPVQGAQTAGSQNQPLINPPIAQFAFYYGAPGVMPSPNYQYSAPMYPIQQSSTSTSPYSKAAANYSGSYSGQYDSGQSGPGPEFKAASSKIQGYPVATSASTLSNLYSKTFEKQNFCQTPPPFANSGGSLGGGYGQTQQQLFYSTMTPHGMAPVDAQGPRSQIAAAAAQQSAKMPAKPNAIRPYANPGTTYWHQQN